MSRVTVPAARAGEHGTGTVGVVGAGTMGVGLTQCLAQAGHDVVVVDPDPRALASGPDRLRDGMRLAAMVGRRPAEPADQVLRRVAWTDHLADLGSAWFVLECVPERLLLKRQLFAQLDEVCPPATVLASITSAVPIDRLAEETSRPELVLGMHVMNPAPLKDTVEVVVGPRTADTTVATAMEVLRTLGKTGIAVRDAPGFVVNRVLMLTVNEAAQVVAAGTADPATVDRLFQECLGHPMGPLRTADLIGLDTVVDTLVVLRDTTGDPRFEPCPHLLELTAAGRLGRKSGSGFYAYPGAPVAVTGR